MRSKNDSGQNANGNPTPKNKGAKKHQMTRKLAEFLSACLGAWWLAASLLGSGFLNYHYTILGGAFIVSALIVLCLGIHVGYRYIYGGHRVVRRAPIYLAGTANIVVAVIATVLIIVLPDPPTYRIAVASSLIRNGPGFGPIVVSDGEFVYSVDRLIFVVLVNMLQSRRNIQGYSLQVVSKAGDIIPTCHYDLRHFKLFWVFTDGSGASELDIDSLDEKLAAGIPAEGEVAGWSAWQCMNMGCPADSTMRFLITDVLGRNELVPLPRKPDTVTPDQFLPKALMKPKSKVPISTLGAATPCLQRQ